MPIGVSPVLLHCVHWVQADAELGRQAFMGMSSDPDPVNININVMDTGNIKTSGSVNLSAGPSSIGDFLIILCPSTSVILNIFDPILPLVNLVLNFTFDVSVRVVGGVSFDAYVLGPLLLGQSFNLTLSVDEP